MTLNENEQVYELENGSVYDLEENFLEDYVHV